MRFSRRILLSFGILVVLASLALLAGHWYQTERQRSREATAAASGLEIEVTSGADRGPGSLREALFAAAGARSRATILVRVPSISLETALPPLVNANGVRIVGPQQGVTIDAGKLENAPVFDVAGANVSLSGLTIRNCPGAAVLLRAARFRLASVTIESCDVGVEVAENARDLTLSRNRFVRNRIGVRFAAASPNTSIVNNEFTGHRDAGLWAVRSTPDLRPGLAVRDNRFVADRMGVVAGNVAIQIDHNELLRAQETAIHLIGEGAVARRNRVSGGAAMGIVAENARGATIESNEIDRIAAYAVMVRGSAATLVRDNRIHNCGYGLAFVLGNASSPSSAVGNSIIGPRFNGIDVIGDSPILRGNRVINPKARPLNVQDFRRPDGGAVHSNPFLEDNNFEAVRSRIAGDSSGQPGSSQE